MTDENKTLHIVTIVVRLADGESIDSIRAIDTKYFYLSDIVAYETIDVPETK